MRTACPFRANRRHRAIGSNGKLIALSLELNMPNFHCWFEQGWQLYITIMAAANQSTFCVARKRLDSRYAEKALSNRD
jgi:hypothetical protein